MHLIGPVVLSFNNAGDGCVGTAGVGPGLFLGWNDHIGFSLKQPCRHVLCLRQIIGNLPLTRILQGLRSGLGLSFTFCNHA